MIILATEVILSVVNATTIGRASRVRLRRARELYKEDLIPVKLGSQVLLLTADVVKKLETTGVWGLLEQAAQRGDDYCAK